MRRFFHAVVLLCVLATPAMAQDGHWYMGLKGGVNGGPEGEATAQGVSVTLENDVGFAAMVTFGYAVKGIRVESELALRENQIGTATLSGGNVFSSTRRPEASADGKLLNLAYMVNGIYEFGGEQMSFTPFVLGGVGFSRVKAVLDRIGIQAYAFEDETTTFAYQVGAGVEYPLSSDFALEVSYRFFGTPSVTFDDVDVTNTHHTGVVGLTLAF